jgi:hypothetical protein
LVVGHVFDPVLIAFVKRGHLFQGRYQAILVEDVTALARVVDYIHLNPVRAGIVSADQIAQFRWSSLGRFVRGARPSFLVANDFLATRGLNDSREGWCDYIEQMQDLAANAAEQERQGFGGTSRGWAIGAASFPFCAVHRRNHSVTLEAIDPNEYIRVIHGRSFGSGSSVDFTASNIARIEGLFLSCYLTPFLWPAPKPQGLTPFLWPRMTSYPPYLEQRGRLHSNPPVKSQDLTSFRSLCLPQSRVKT